jgi:hypothetical protein
MNQRITARCIPSIRIALVPRSIHPALLL